MGQRRDMPTAPSRPDRHQSSLPNSVPRRNWTFHRKLTHVHRELQALIAAFPSADHVRKFVPQRCPFPTVSGVDFNDGGCVDASSQTSPCMLTPGGVLRSISDLILRGGFISDRMHCQMERQPLKAAPANPATTASARTLARYPNRAARSCRSHPADRQSRGS